MLYDSFYYFSFIYSRVHAFKYWRLSCLTPSVGLRHSYLELRWCRVPLRRTALCEKAHGKRRSCNNPHTFALEVRQQIQEGRIVDAVMTIRKNHIYRARGHPIKNVSKHLQRQTCYSDEPRLSGRFQLLKCRYRLIYNLELKKNINL